MRKSPCASESSTSTERAALRNVNHPPSQFHRNEGRLFGNDNGHVTCHNYHTFDRPNEQKNIHHHHHQQQQEQQHHPLPLPPIPPRSTNHNARRIRQSPWWCIRWYRKYRQDSRIDITTKKLDDGKRHNTWNLWIVCSLLPVLVLLLTLFVLRHGKYHTMSSWWTYLSHPDQITNNSNNHNNDSYNHIVEWRWDHNAYFHHSRSDEHADTHDVTDLVIKDDSVDLYDTEDHRDRAVTTPNDRNLLMAQIVGHPPPEYNNDQWNVVDTSTAKQYGNRKRHQTAPHRTNQSPPEYSSSVVWSDLAEITSRPNRAYARQWNRNYVRVPIRRSQQHQKPPHSDDDPSTDHDPHVSDITYTISHFLKVILDEQQQQLLLDTSVMVPDNHTLPLESSVPQYNTVAILLPGSIILDLDYDLLQLIPTDTFISMSGGGSHTRTTTSKYNNRNRTNHHHEHDDNVDIPNGIFFINLQHPHANEFINLWWDKVQPPTTTTTTTMRDDNDSMASKATQSSTETMIRWDGQYQLLQMIQSLLMEMNPKNHPKDDNDSLLLHLQEAKGGFVVEVPYQSPHTTAGNRFTNTTAMLNTDDMNNDESTGRTNSYAYCIKSFLWKSYTSSVRNDADVEWSNPWSDVSPATTSVGEILSVLTTVQTIADAVCYRFYPKCEIL